MRAVALCVALAASLSHAAPVDAPTMERPAQTFKAGEVVPYDATCMTDGRTIEVGKRLASAEAQVAALEGKSIVSTPVLVAGGAAIVAVIVAVAAAGFVAGKASR